MNNPAYSYIIAILLLSVLTGCPSGQDKDGAGIVAVAEDDHSGEDHAPHAEPAAEDPHAGHDHGAEDAAAEDENGISLSPQQILELDITTLPAGPGTLASELELSGEIAINEDEITHVVSSTSGVVRKVNYKLGNQVKKGAAMVELDSPELAELKSSYLALLSQLELLKQNMDREELLVDKGISAQQDYLEAKQAHEEKLIEKRALEQKLRIFGVSDERIAALPESSDSVMTAFTVYAPASGEILEKHVALGELVDSSTSLFTIGNLGTVWARLNIYQENMTDIQRGMDVLIDAGHGIEAVSGRIDYIEPIIGESTRTAVARVVLPRSNAEFRPGLFVTGYVEIGGELAGLVVPRNAVIELDEDKMVFVRVGDTFVPRVVSIGRETSTSIEILSGVEPNEDVVVTGAFQLKAELLKGTFDPHAGHAH
jgi:cobalt-zinc-cadmium efflux system membrane fusion protein